MNRLARAFVLTLLLSAAGLGAGCGGLSLERTDPIWEKMAREGN